jgi:hypothetical protein
MAKAMICRLASASAALMVVVAPAARAETLAELYE